MKKFIFFVMGLIILASCSVNRRVAEINAPTQVISEYHMTPEMEDLSINGVVYLISIDRLVDAKTGQSSLKTQYHWVYDYYYGKAVDKMAMNPPVMFND